MKTESTSEQEYKVVFGSKTIVYSVERSKRTTLGISVNPDASVSVIAPYDASLVLIREKVLKRADWIINQQIDFIEMDRPKSKFKYNSGETHWYLGKQYRLKFMASDVRSVSREDQYLIVRGTRDAETTSSLLSAWYRDKAEQKIDGLIKNWWGRFGQFENLPKFSIRKIEKRWGSCTAKGQLVFNEDLIKTPSQCIEYVVVHELCHLFEHNHGPKFISLMTRHLPEWENIKRRLETFEL